MVNFAHQGKHWWRLVAILTCNSFVILVQFVISLVHVFVLKSCLRLFKSRFYYVAFSKDSMQQPLTVKVVGGADARASGASWRSTGKGPCNENSRLDSGKGA